MPTRNRPYAVARAAYAAILLAVLGLALGAAPAAAHGFSSTVYADLTAPERGHVRAELGLEYDLLVVSTADAEKDDALFREGTAAFDARDTARQAAALTGHTGSVVGYVSKRFAVTAQGQACTPSQDGGYTMTERDGVPYALLVLDYSCPEHAEAHEIRSALFGNDEGYVRDTKTILTYELDLKSGSAALDTQRPSFSTQQSWTERFWDFFRLGAEHLLTGLDHILFLLALIAGSRRLREIVLAATSFTVAHSVTFVLAALGLVKVPASFVEPVIALSIAVVAGWHLWRLRQRGLHAGELDTIRNGHFSLDRAGWIRLGVVFCFGLVHGLGFASALGIDAAWSWQLLWSLLVFNVGLEAVQLSLIVLVFPVLALLRRRTPVAGLWVTGALSAGVAVTGLVWFVQRVTGS
ncbi:HupE/UreJ family protein [Kribbella sp. CA-253562]|uniref:HupE/UreJ family protein n=1 Tax=Kribbella sp. CA-253562 TaxID=3239942 RepID=UPI003D8A273D